MNKISVKKRKQEDKKAQSMTINIRDICKQQIIVLYFPFIYKNTTTTERGKNSNKQKNKIAACPSACIINKNIIKNIEMESVLVQTM